jgi:hypothetical protein
MNRLPREKFDKVKDRTLGRQGVRHPLLLLRFDFNERGAHRVSPPPAEDDNGKS